MSVLKVRVILEPDINVSIKGNHVAGLSRTDVLRHNFSNLSEIDIVERRI